MGDTTNIIGYRYQALEQLGSGGMGTVYRAHDRLTNTEIALKRLNIAAEQLQFSSRGSLETVRLSLAREFRILASLRHPNIISVLDYGFDEFGQPYFAMELLLGGSDLTDASLTARGDKIQWLIQLLQALIYLHRRDIIHRDLKPANVMVTADNHLRVLDFGVAIDPTISRENMAGTIAYMSPEALQQQKLTPAADLFAVGIMAYEMFAGQRPFIGSTMEIIMSIMNDMPDPDAMDTTPEVAEVVMRLLAKNPADRYASAQDAIIAFSDAIGQAVPAETLAMRQGFIEAATFVGRDGELAQLTDAFKAAKQGAGSIWLVGGESGVGKSRLMDELRIRALVDGGTVLTGQMSENSAITYELWRNPLRQLVLMRDLDDLTAAILKELVPDVAALLERDIPDPTAMTGIAAQQRLKSTIVALFQQQTTPLVVILEDLQWAQESLDILDVLAAQVADLPIIFIGTYRNDERPNLPDEFNTRVQTLALNRLDTAAIAELSESIFGRSQQDSGIVELLHEQTEGNAFFIVEVLRTLADDAGSLERIGQVTIPPGIYSKGIQQVIDRRLQRVPEQYQRLLTLAAIYGRVLNIAVLEHLHGQAVDAFLYACEQAAVFDVRDNQWRFAHDKLREALLNRLTDSDTRIYAKQLAQAIETVHADTLDQYALMLSKLWRSADNRDKEGIYVLQAADNAKNSSLYRDALPLYERVLAIEAYRLHEHPERVHADMLHNFGVTNFELAHTDTGIKAIEEAITMYKAIGDDDATAHALISLANTQRQLMNLDKAKALFDEAETYALRVGSDERLGLYYSSRAIYEHRINDIERFYDLAIKADEHLKRTDNRAAYARNLNALGIHFDFGGDFDQSEAYHTEAIAIREAISDQQGLISSYMNYAYIFIGRARNTDDSAIADSLYAQAAEYTQKSIDIATRLHLRRSLIYPIATLGDIATAREQYMQAYQHYFHSLQIAEQIEQVEAYVSRYLYLAHTCFSLQAYDEALQWSIKRAMGIYDAQDERNYAYAICFTGAMLILTDEQVERGLELLTLGRAEMTDKDNQSMFDSDYIAVAEQEAQTRLSDEAYQAALQRANERTIDEAMQWITESLQNIVKT